MKTRRIYNDKITTKTLGGKKFICSTNMVFNDKYYTEETYPVANFFGVNGNWEKGFKIIGEVGEWKCTDADTNQWGRHVHNNILFEFKEDRGGEVFEDGIDISGFTDAEIESTINAYGYTLYESNGNLHNVFDEYGDDANWIIAECLFEMES